MKFRVISDRLTLIYSSPNTEGFSLSSRFYTMNLTNSLACLLCLLPSLLSAIFLVIICTAVPKEEDDFVLEPEFEISR